MWLIDCDGFEFESCREAFVDLRERAIRAIEAGDAQDVNTRSVRVRLRHENGAVLFDGTMDEASRLHIDGKVYIAAL